MTSFLLSSLHLHRGSFARCYRSSEGKGRFVQHMHVSTSLFTDPTIVEAIKKRHGVVTIENHLISAVLGSAVADVIAERTDCKRLVKIGLPGYPHGASKMV